ncbi:hypothetical protein CDAR_465671 [Caerostris darwini]|uniref:Uncharacterized protein n=1 Tax=Caerostris darwini TaxID=1538125 RepID=A0AAV4TXB3_9ARAC|nr:hypothetical protein CDAR_465671 [Caerostris darwini]
MHPQITICTQRKEGKRGKISLLAVNQNSCVIVIHVWCHQGRSGSPFWKTCITIPLRWRGISQCYSPGKLERLFSGKSFLTKSKRDRSPFHLVVVRKAGAIVFLRPVGFVSRDWKRTSSSCLVGLLFWKKLFKQR